MVLQDTKRDFAAIVPLKPHAFVANTVMLPLLLPNVTVMVSVPWPLIMVEPGGTFHVYEAAPETLFTQYMLVPLLHGFPLPYIAAGAAGAVLMTAKAEGE